MSKAKEKILTMIFAFAIAVCTIFSMVQISNLGAKAEGYSGVLQDLQKDESFQAENYPLIENDDSLQLIQIAESTGKELFLYVYQPSGEAKNFTASSVNISTTINDEISFLTYRLQKIDSSGTLYKYKVRDFTVKSESTRYYVISSIYRPFDESVDKPASGGNTVTEVNFAVNKQYTFGKINGKEYVSCVDIETIEITDKFVGFVRYENGFNLYASACDSHFVAFNTDKRIDSLLEADVYYTTQKYRWSFINFVGEKETFGKKEDKYAYLKYTDKVEHTGDGLFAGTYKWDRIESVEKFTGSEDKTKIYKSRGDDKSAVTLTDETLNELKGKKWVLRFTETDYIVQSGGTTGATTANSTLVGDVTILRLKFVTDGITYNLGVIDNKQTGGREPSNEPGGIGGSGCAAADGKKLLYVLLGLIALIILAPLLPMVVNGIVFVISLPFKGIAEACKNLHTKHERRKIEKRVRKEFQDKWQDEEWW